MSDKSSKAIQDRVVAVPEGAPPPGWSTRQRRFALGLLGLSSVLNLLDRQAISILIEPIKHEFHLSDTQIGLLTGLAFAFSYCLVAFPMARWLDRAARTTIFAGALIFWSACTVLSGLGTSYWLLLAARVGVAAGEAGASPAQASLVSDLYPGRGLPKAMAVLSVGASLGAALSLLVGGWLSQQVGWRATFMILGAPGILLGLLILFTLREPVRRMVSGAAAVATGESLGRVFAHLFALRGYRWIVAAYGTLSISGFAVLVWTPSLLIRVHHMPVAQVGFALGLATALGLAGGSFAGGHLGAAMGARDIRWHLRLGGVFCLLAVPSGLLIAFSPDIAAAIIGAFLFMACTSVWLAPTGAMVQALAPPRMRGMASAITIFAQTLAGVGVGPLLVGMLNDALLATHGPGGIRLSIAISLTGAAVAGLCLLRANASIPRDYAAAARADAGSVTN